MIAPAASELIRRSREQIANGIQCVLRGDLALAEVWLRAGMASLDALHALLDEPAQKPLRKLAIVGPREEEAELPTWATRKHNGSDPDAT